MSLSIIILAAGKSTRMNSTTPKVMNKISMRPALGYILETVASINPTQIILVTSQNMDQVREFADSQYEGIIHVIQTKQLGTGDAVKAALPYLDSQGDSIILYGDAPLISASTLNKLKEKSTDAVLVAFNSQFPGKNGRVVTYNDDLIEIVEFNEASEEEKSITLCNSGIYSIKNIHLHQLIPLIKNNNSKSEFYLTDIVKLITQKEISCSILEACEKEMKNFNTQEELSIVEDIMQKKIKSQLMQQGVKILNPDTSFFAYDFQAETDCIIYPNVYIGNNVILRKNTTILSFCFIEGAKIEENSVIGPFARIRPWTNIDSKSKIGNFVEVKNSSIGKNSKINHLSYIGDSEIANNVNIGAGTITCNFDGIKTKSKTLIGSDVSIGSNCSLIAPLTIKNGAFVAAGSVITNDVNENDLVFARSKQVNLSGKADFLRKKL